MPESVSTEDIHVATVLAATELTKNAAIVKSPEVIASAFKTIYQAIVEARSGT